jgi:hypothetical protein
LHLALLRLCSAVGFDHMGVTSTNCQQPCEQVASEALECRSPLFCSQCPCDRDEDEAVRSLCRKWVCELPVADRGKWHDAKKPLVLVAARIPEQLQDGSQTGKN